MRSAATFCGAPRLEAGRARTAGQRSACLPSTARQASLSLTVLSKPGRLTFLFETIDYDFSAGRVSFFLSDKRCTPNERKVRFKSEK